MDTLNKKTLKVSRDFTYTYYAHPAKPQHPTLLLLHGFPDCAAEWSDLMTSHLIPAGYGVIAPDCLGYGGSSKPTDPAAYKLGSMARDMTDILDAEDVNKAIVLGHDWGTVLAQYVYNTAPDRVCGLALINVAYSAPSNRPFDLDALLDMTEKFFGHGLLWYWKLFTSDDGARICNEHLDEFFDALHVPGEQWKDIMCKPDGLKNILVEGKRLEVQPYATEELRKEWVGRMRRDGFEAPLCWYKSMILGHQIGEADEQNVVVKCPSLYVGWTKDILCRHEMLEQSKQAELLPNLTEAMLEGSHWGLLDKKKEFGETVVGWLEKTY